MLSWFESHQVEVALREQWMREVQRLEFESVIGFIPLGCSGLCGARGSAAARLSAVVLRKINSGLP